MNGIAQALGQSLQRRLQRQQMDQQADLEDQNNAVQMLTQGQQAQQADMGRDAAVERVKSLAATAAQRASMMHEDAQAKLRGEGERAAAKGKDAMDRWQAEEARKEREAAAKKEKEDLDRKNKLDVQRAKPQPRAPAGHAPRPDANFITLTNEMKAINAREAALNRDLANAQADYKTDILNRPKHLATISELRANLDRVTRDRIPVQEELRRVGALLNSDTALKPPPPQ